MSSNMYTYNSTPELHVDQIITADVTNNERVKDVFRQSEDDLYISYLNNITKMMWIYTAPILFLIGTGGNVTSIIIMLRYFFF